MAAFLSELRPQSLEKFDSTGEIGSGVGPQSFQALNCHGESLVELKLAHLPSDAVFQVFLLKDCTNLTSLSLGKHVEDMEDDIEGDIDFEIEHNKAFHETVAWLRDCNKLRKLNFSRFPGASALLASTLLENSIRLTSLQYKSVEFLDAEKVLPALANQTGLRHLYLKDGGSDGDYRPGAADDLVECLSKLVNLTELHMIVMGGKFDDIFIVRLANSLPKLEIWVNNGYPLTDDIWNAVASLRSLRTLIFRGLTYFTVDGILEFIEKLGPGNRGLYLGVEKSRVKYSWENQKLINARISQRVGGGFNFNYKNVIY